MACASVLEGKYAKPLAHAMTSNLAITGCFCDCRIVQYCLLFVCMLLQHWTTSIWMVQILQCQLVASMETSGGHPLAATGTPTPMYSITCMQFDGQPWIMQTRGFVTQHAVYSGLSMWIHALTETSCHTCMLFNNVVWTCNPYWHVHVTMELLMRTVGVHQSDCAGLFRCADTWRIGWPLLLWGLGGGSFGTSGGAISLWAPTAQQVCCLLYIHNLDRCTCTKNDSSFSLYRLHVQICMCAEPLFTHFQHYTLVAITHICIYANTLVQSNACMNHFMSSGLSVYIRISRACCNQAVNNGLHCM